MERARKFNELVPPVLRLSEKEILLFGAFSLVVDLAYYRNNINVDFIVSRLVALWVEYSLYFHRWNAFIYAIIFFHGYIMTYSWVKVHIQEDDTFSIVRHYFSLLQQTSQCYVLLFLHIKFQEKML